MSAHTTILIQKYLAEQGIVSRREGERLVHEGKVLVNGVRATNGQHIDPTTDTVELDKEHAEQKITIAVHKPRGIVCSRNPLEGKTIYQLLPQFENLHVVGRLDKESEGLLLLTNDGLVSRKVTGEDHTVEKEYVVTVRERLFQGLMERMQNGIIFDGEQTLPCIATINPESLDKDAQPVTYKGQTFVPQTFTIVLKQGRKHQIRRMCEACKLTVVSLKRVRIGHVKIEKLEVGKYRTVAGKIF
jgi:23S rRNA pseudouridine2604 synthase